MPQLKPRQTVPDLALATVGGGAWRLSEQSPEHFTMIVAYRGLHCPICATYLRDLDRRVEGFTARGVETIAISCDDEVRAREAHERWKIENLALGYGLSIKTAREWGLFISAGIGKTSVGVEEPDLFCEPGLFLIRPDRTLYASFVITMPFARPDFAAIDKALETIIRRDYPARGEA
jgi:peroxiredoxin